ARFVATAGWGRPRLDEANVHARSGAVLASQAAAGPVSMWRRREDSAARTAEEAERRVSVSAGCAKRTFASSRRGLPPPALGKIQTTHANAGGRFTCQSLRDWYTAPSEHNVASENGAPMKAMLVGRPFSP